MVEPVLLPCMERDLLCLEYRQGSISTFQSMNGCSLSSRALFADSLHHTDRQASDFCMSCRAQKQPGWRGEKWGLCACVILDTYLLTGIAAGLLHSTRTLLACWTWCLARSMRARCRRCRSRASS